MNRPRKGSPKTFKMEPTGPKVPSRYLIGPTSSCHDNCKPTTPTKPINPLPKRIPKPPVDSVPKINKPPSVIPKITTHSFKNNNVVKDQTLKKAVAVEPKKRDFKLKSVNSQAKTYNRSPSRTPRRRLSDVFVPKNDMSLPSSRFPKRRLSDIASVSNGSTVRGSGINKNESRKDSKLPLVNKKASTLITTVSTSKTNVNVSPLRTYKSIPKPELNGSRKSKPVKPIAAFVPEKTPQVIEPNNVVEITKSQSQSQRSPDGSPSSSEVKAMKDDQNEATGPSPPSLEDDQNVTVESSPPSLEDDQNVAVESSPRSLEDDQNEVVESSPPSLDDQNVIVESLPPSLEVDQNAVVESSPPSDNQNVVVESSPPPLDDQNAMVESSPPPLDDQNVVVESSPPLLEDNQNVGVELEDDTLAKYDQQNDNISDSEINDTTETTSVEKLAVETNDCSLDDQRFRRGTILSPESEYYSLIELQFKKGKELENETKKGENISLRRLSSDGVVCISESQTISVDLKHQEVEEKKDAVLFNNVIEETASKLIQTRKSKVKALVGAFETIVSGESPRMF